jgi:isopentenyldiphosphate isomerase
MTTLPPEGGLIQCSDQSPFRGQSASWRTGVRVILLICPIFVNNSDPVIMPSDEIFPVVDEEGNEISQAPRSVCHDGKSMLLHPVVHLHLFNSSGSLFLQKRSLTKDLLPGKWDTSVGGHVSPGEDPVTALKREALEELGISSFSFKLNRKYIWESSRERELVYSFTGQSGEALLTNPEEIEDGKFWEIDEIRKNIGKEIFTPNFEFEFDMLNIIS